MIFRVLLKFLTKLTFRPPKTSKDGDCVCFGARRVYRTFSSESDAEIELLEMAKVDAKFNRFDFIACAILLGCDFFPGKSLFDFRKIELFKNFRKTPIEYVTIVQSGSKSNVAESNVDLLNRTSQILDSIDVRFRTTL